MSIAGKAGSFGINQPGRGETQEIILNYDFAKDGGAVGDIAMRGEAVPSGAIVTDALIIVDTPPTSDGSATIAIKLQGANDVQTAAAFDGSPWSAATAKRASAITATAAPLKATAARQATVTVGTADLTGGTFKLILKYVQYDSSVA